MEIKDSCIDCKYGFGHVSQKDLEETRCHWAGMSGFLSQPMPKKFNTILTARFSIEGSGKINADRASFEIDRDAPVVNCPGYKEGTLNAKI